MNRPARIAIVGSGPSGMYAVEHLLQNQEIRTEIDIFERLPVPWGLVRFGVAPDHPEKKLIINRLFSHLMSHEKVRFFGNVEIGKDISHEQLSHWYDGVIYASGVSSDNKMNIPKEDLPGCWSAREFVGWYNGHPDYRHLHFDFSSERAVVVGNGNVALDVARILLLPIDELKKTDIANYAIEALRHSSIQEVIILGRRAFYTAAYNNPELEELLHIDNVKVSVEDPTFIAADKSQYDWVTRRKIHTLQQLLAKSADKNAKRLIFKFLSSPVELVGETKVEQLKIMHNHDDEKGNISTIKTHLLFRAIGYRGQAFPGLPFDEQGHVIENIRGRICARGKTLLGAYVTGWVKRGPKGVIGTNKQCSGETVACLLEDLASASQQTEDTLSAAEVLEQIKRRKSNFVSLADWLKIDNIEKTMGLKARRPRVKISDLEEMLNIAHG